MEAWKILTAIGTHAAIFMTLLWIWQWFRKDATIVDAGWSFGLVGAAAFIGVNSPGDPLRRSVFTLLTMIWAARLGIYLFSSRIMGRSVEDGRYARMRRSMGRLAQPGFFAFFHVQTVFIVIFAIPFLGPAWNPAPFPTLFDVLGMVIWTAAMAGEWTADYQLHRFVKNPENKGKTCRSGLWNRTRHPNYFFEWLHWFAYAAAAIGSPLVWTSLAGPVLMLIFLFLITGIPHTEKQALSHRPDYAGYIREVPMFFPRILSGRMKK